MANNPNIILSASTVGPGTEMLNASMKTKDAKNKKKKIRRKLPPPSSSRRLRTELLHKLGIDGTGAMPLTGMGSPQQSTTAVVLPERSLLGDTKPFSEALKYDQSDDVGDEVPNSIWAGSWSALFLGPQSNSSTESTSTTLSSRTASSEQRKRLTFVDEVSVMPIPRREDYSDRVRERLWCSPTELFENAQRNSLEFAAEGWDWRTVVEDDSMYRCSISNERIHPVHCEYPYLNN